MAQEAEVAPEALNLKQVARELGVHYMTAYRYVRLGTLPARRDGSVWLVEAADLARFRARPSGSADAGNREAVDWVERLGRMLLAGDETGAWTVVCQALAAGHTPQRCYLDLIAGSVAAIGDAVASGELAIADQYLATATAQRVAGRLGTRFRRRGRSRGVVVLGAPTGELHALPVAIVADLVRLAGFTVLELGANVPPEAFALAAERADALVAVGVGVTTVDHLDAAAAVVAAVRRARPDVAVLIGGQAVRSPEVAAVLGVDGWAADGQGVVDAVERLARRAHRARR